MLQKIKSYWLVLILLCLCSCADEGPYTIGKFECNIEISSVTPQTAVVSITIPDSKDNLIASGNNNRRLYLIDHPLSNTQEIEYGQLIRSEDVKNFKGTKFSFSNLSPNTTYYVVLEDKFYLNGQYEYSEWEYYYSGYSFTTKKEDDSTFFSDLDYELSSFLGMYNSEFCTNVILELPYQMDYTGTLSMRLSKSSDMANSIESTIVSKTYSSYLNAQANFIFPLLEKGTYYVEIKGNFSFLKKNYNNVVIRPKNQLYYLESDVDLSGSTCEVVEYLSCKDVFIPLVQFNFPPNIYGPWTTSGTCLYASEHKDMENMKKSVKTLSSGNHNSKIFAFTDLEKVEYYFTYFGDVQYNGNRLVDCSLSAQNSLDFSKLSSSDNVLNRIECKLIDAEYTSEDNKKYTIIEVTLPENLVFLSQYSTFLYASDNPDMNNRIKCIDVRGTKDRMWYYFPVLEKKTYYFELTDRLAYCYYDVYDFSWKISNSLDLSSVAE